MTEDATPGRRVRYMTDLLRELVARDMKVRYKRTALGIGWSLVNPLAQLLVLGFTFRVILRLEIPNYSEFLLIGVLAWSWFQASLVAGTTVILENGDLLRRPGFPALILPVASVTTQLVHFVFALPLLLGWVWLAGTPLTAAALALPLVVMVQLVLTLGLTYLVAALHVTFRDTQYLLGVFLVLAFYLTPVFYDAAAAPPRYDAFFMANPVRHLLDAYRAMLIDGALPDGKPLLAVLGASLAVLAFGISRFQRASHRFVEEL